MFKNCSPFTNYITETNNAQLVDDAKDVEIAMPMYRI